MEEYWTPFTRALGVYKHKVGSVTLFYVTKVPEPYVEVYCTGNAYLFRKVAVFKIKLKNI